MLIFESIFIQIALQLLEEERSKDSGLLSPNAQEALMTSSGSLHRIPNRQRLRASVNQLGSSPEFPETVFHQSSSTGNLDRIRRAASSSSLNTLGKNIKTPR